MIPAKTHARFQDLRRSGNILEGSHLSQLLEDVSGYSNEETIGFLWNSMNFVEIGPKNGDLPNKTDIFRDVPLV